MLNDNPNWSRDQAYQEEAKIYYYLHHHGCFHVARYVVTTEYNYYNGVLSSKMTLGVKSLSKLDQYPHDLNKGNAIVTSIPRKKNKLFKYLKAKYSKLKYKEMMDNTIAHQDLIGLTMMENFTLEDEETKGVITGGSRKIIEFNEYPPALIALMQLSVLI